MKFCRTHKNRNAFGLLFCFLSIILQQIEETVGGACDGHRCFIQNCDVNLYSPVWTHDGVLCEVSRNDCFLQNYNCRRFKNCRTEARLVSKEFCQRQCSKYCIHLYGPVCAEYMGKTLTFMSYCEMKSRNCFTGETWRFLHYNICLWQKTRERINKKAVPYDARKCPLYRG